MSHFYFNGCSFTYGEELKDPGSSRFSRLVSDHFNETEINEALCGGSNWRIARKFTEHVHTNRPKFVFIMWTDVNRFEITTRGNLEHILPPGETSLPIYTYYLSKNHSSRPKEFPLNQCLDFYDSIFIDEMQYFNWFSQILQIQTYCKSNQIPYVMTRAFNRQIHYQYNVYPKAGKKMKEHFDWYFDAIDWSCWIDNGTWYFDDFTTKNNFEEGPNFHPLEDAHKAAADYFINFIEKKYGSIN